MDEISQEKNNTPLENQETQDASAEEAAAPPEAPGTSLKIRLMVFAQLFIMAFTWGYIWYFPRKAGVGTFSWNGPLLAGSFAILAAILILAAAIVFLLPYFKKHFDMEGTLAATLVNMAAASILLLFILIFIINTVNIALDFRLPTIDPFPFLRWAKFLL